MSKYKNIKSEHQLRSLVFDDYFKTKGISWEQEISNIDFVITDNKSRIKKDTGAEKHYVWMETKRSPTDHYIMLVQLVLTIKKPYENNDFIVPNYIGCFDTEKIVFVPMKLLQSVMHDNDIKWNITPSDTKNEYFLKILNKLKYNLHGVEEFKIFKFEEQDEEIKDFIKENVYKGITENKFEITEHNFDRVYYKWIKKVKPSIAINWEEEKGYGILDGDFFLADLLSRNDLSIKERLLIVLQNDHYKLTQALKRGKKLIDDDKYFFKDKQKAYNEFWSIYKRPPLDKYWENIIDRKDLLVPQDIRERKGSFFTPQIWVELSQKYIADVLGENWQDKYYIWDCCAGTGNLLVGINRKPENVFASTIDESDVKAMYDRIDNGAKLLKKNVFQFDFLNDSLTSSKIPKVLKEILQDSRKRKKLIIYINPPYAEATSKGSKSKVGVSKSYVFDKYIDTIGNGINELFLQFFVRIHEEIKGCILASFSKLKYINSQNFGKFRDHFTAEYKKGFICPADTFDNVVGKFPIGFLIWDLSVKKKFKSVKVDIRDFDKKNEIYINLGKKTLSPVSKNKFIIDWFRKYYDKESENIGVFRFQGTDFQNQNQIYITLTPTENDIRESKITNITKHNLFEVCIYFAVRKCIKANWINDRDQFLYPNDKYINDINFVTDCLIYTLFHDSNIIQYNKKIKNHWIPFTEKEVGAKQQFESHFMSDFLAGKIKNGYDDILFNDDDKVELKGKLKLSQEAKDVYNAGKELWKLFHKISRAEPNASLYDIKAEFQGINKDGRMNSKSNNEEYNKLMGMLKEKMKILASVIEPKVYEYGFLKK